MLFSDYFIGLPRQGRGAASPPPAESKGGGCDDHGQNLWVARQVLGFGGQKEPHTHPLQELILVVMLKNGKCSLLLEVPALRQLIIKRCDRTGLARVWEGRGPGRLLQFSAAKHGQ